MILRAAPWMMKALSVAGTAAMFLVGGGILTHGITPLHHAIEGVAQRVGGTLGAVLPTLLDGVSGIVAGGVAVGAVTLFQRLRGGPAPAQ